jgi:hypothetical protein
MKSNGAIQEGAIVSGEIPVTLYTLANGAAAELFEAELQKIVANILDPNTDPDAVREINLRVKIKPDNERRAGAVSVQVISKTGPVKGVGTMFWFGRKAGQYIAVENNPQQGILFDQNRPVAVDFQTGEVKE